MLEEVPVATPSIEGQASGTEADTEEFLNRIDAFHIDVLRADQTASESTSPVLTPRQQRLRMWYHALKKKKKLVEKLLEKQRIIEDVEHEASQYLTMDTIALYRRRYYDLDIKDDAEGTFMSTVSDVRLDGEKGFL